MSLPTTELESGNYNAALQSLQTLIDLLEYQIAVNVGDGTGDAMEDITLTRSMLDTQLNQYRDLATLAHAQLRLRVSKSVKGAC